MKIAPPVIADSLTYIFNQVITQSSFPDAWKMARVTPVFKNGQRNLPENYRPISVLPTISKIMERILYDQLYNYLTKFEFLVTVNLVFENLTPLLQHYWTVSTCGMLIWTRNYLTWLF